MKKNEKAKTTPAKKTVSTSKAVKKTAKPAAKTTTKPAKAASVKAAPKSTKALVSKKATPAKASAAKSAAKKAPVKAAPAKKATKAPAPVKKAVKKAAPAPVKKATVKATPVKKAEKVTKVAPATKTTSSKKVVQKEQTAPAASSGNKSPIFVKSPLNQNMPTVSTGSVKPVISIAPQKASSPAASNLSVSRPVYRPIQVINKPLAPLQPTRQMAPIEKEGEKVEFKKGDYVCYPAHGVGEIEAVETQIIGGMEIKLYAIAFEKDRMRLKVPVAKAHASGLRRLSSAGRMEDALKTLQGRAHVRRAMWSRRAQEYETKINSGDPVSIAEVLRDLKRSNDETEQSYSERQIYQSALERLAREVAAVERISEEAAAERLENMIKGRKARAAAEKSEKKEQAA